MYGKILFSLHKQGFLYILSQLICAMNKLEGNFGVFLVTNRGTLSCSRDVLISLLYLPLWSLPVPWQALIYPLTVATKSQSVLRHDAAETVLANLREHSADLVQQAIMVSEELIRVAILWHEQWHEALEDASRSGPEREGTRTRDREKGGRGGNKESQCAPSGMC